MGVPVAAVKAELEEEVESNVVGKGDDLAEGQRWRAIVGKYRTVDVS
jgi:hypothetical protein